MAFMFKLVPVLIALSIVSDVTNLGYLWLNSNRHPGDIRFMQSPSLIFPGAYAQSLEDYLVSAVAKAMVDNISSDEKKDKDG